MTSDPFDGRCRRCHAPMQLQFDQSGPIDVDFCSDERENAPSTSQRLRMLAARITLAFSLSRAPVAPRTRNDSPWRDDQNTVNRTRADYWTETGSEPYPNTQRNGWRPIGADSTPEYRRAILNEAARWYGGVYRRRSRLARWWLLAGSSHAIAFVVAAAIVSVLGAACFALTTGVTQPTPGRIIGYLLAGFAAILVVLALVLWTRRD